MYKYISYFLFISLLTFILTSSWSTYILLGIPLSTSPLFEKYGYIYIYITDPYGKFLLDAKLYIYKGGSLIISRKVSGSISLKLQEGSYKIKVEKKGYVDFSENVYISKGTKLTLKAILKPAIEIAGSVPLNLTLSPYREEKLSLKVHNNGRWEEEVKLMIMLHDPPLIIPVIQVNGKQIVNSSIIRIDPKSSIDLELTLKSLNNYGKTHLVIVLEYRGIKISRNFTITIAKDQLKLFKTPVNSVTASPGKELTFTFYLLNPTWFSETFVLRCKAPTGWMVNLLYQDNAIEEISLEPASSAELTLRVNIPFDVSNGTYIIALIAEGKTTNMNETMVLKIVVKGACNVLSIKSEKPYLGVNVGSLAKYPVVVLNRYSKDLLLNFTVKGLPSNYPFWIEDESGNRLSSLYLRSGEETKVYLCIKIPEDAPISTFSFKFIVSSSNQENSINLYLNVVGKYNIDIVTENFLIEIYSGGEAIYNLEVKNTGSLELTNITFDVVKCPQDMNVTVTPKEIMMLKPGETCSFKLVVKLKQSIPAGDYYLLFRIKTDQVSTITYGLRISVRQRETIIFIATSIILIVLIILVIVYKKYGRR
ncbi:MAG: hypothetical protein B6U76_05345 [Desulfurococcales archaeon ex4484_217_2]|nr:MAG: hypothetical protein B6U76_05345 [Desulfurococcales archaeon ex4484_217_2]